MPYLLDTNIIVDTLREIPSAIAYVDSLGQWSYWVMTTMEVIAGARDQREVDALEEYLRHFLEVELSPEIETKGREIMKKYARAEGLDPIDAVIAATAIIEGFTLVTKNRKHFRKIEGLSFEVPDYS